MSEMNSQGTRHMTIRHRGRGAQVWICLGKMLRMFVYQSDWKVLPMTALIAGLVGMVVRNRLFVSMEGSLMGAFAMVIVCLWNGCFNSIQAICRERDVIRREHRSGMHISSYIVAQMIYQALLCLMQTGVMLYVTKNVGVEYAGAGQFTPWKIVDFGISMFLITYASDMLSLWVSCLVRTTTAAMTIMPFVLIFQLVLSGGMLSLPSWTRYITPFTISNPALKVMAAQSDYNALPVMTVWNAVNGMRDKEISVTVTLGQVLELLQNEDIAAVAELRGTRISRVFTLGEIKQMLDGSETFEAFREEHVLEDMTLRDVLIFISEAEELQAIRDYNFNLPGITVGRILKEVLASDKLGDMLDQSVAHLTTVGDVLDTLGTDELMERYADLELGRETTLGELVDLLAGNPDVQAHLDDSYTYETSVGSIIDMVGEDKVADILQNRIAEVGRVVDYNNDLENILDCWFTLLLFVLAFAALSVITLAFKSLPIWLRTPKGEGF